MPSKRISELSSGGTVTGAEVFGGVRSSANYKFTMQELYAGGWIGDPRTWVYVSAGSFQITGVDVAYQFPKGARLRFKQGGAYKYMVVSNATYSGGNTTVTCTGGSDYTIANSAITNNAYSYEATPEGYPPVFNWTPVFLSDNSNHTLGNGTITGTFSVLGDEVTVTVVQTWGSTTANGTGKYYLQAVPAGSYPTDGPLGTVAMYDSSSVAWHVGICHSVNSRICGQTAGSTSQWRNDTPTTWATSDTYRMSFRYWM